MKKLTLSAFAAAMALTGNVQAETTIGGYGELHLNQLQTAKAGNNDKQEIDFHRFVLFFGHEFNENIRMFSEFELEHSLAGANTRNANAPGEVELEQAYIEMDIADNHQFRAGVMLVPVGILNETHEPPTFYGTERNPIEAKIIPSTWWEGGVALTGQFGEGFSYDFMISSGLNAGADNPDIRSGRQKVAKASAENPAYTGRIKFTGVKGLELATTVQVQEDITQIETDTVGGATLVEAHAIYNIANLTLKALYAQWDIDIDSTAALALQAEDEQEGYFVEAGYKITDKIGVFARHNEWSLNQSQEDNTQMDVGVNYWPHENVVFKADYQQQNTQAGDYDGINLGVGYQF